MAVAALRSLRSALLARLKANTPVFGGRWFTPPVPTGTAFPYGVVSADAEDYTGHYGHSGSDTGVLIKWFVSTVPSNTNSGEGDLQLLQGWEQIYAAVQDVPLAVTGHQWLRGEVRMIARYPDPDVAAQQGVARYEALTFNSA